MKFFEAMVNVGHNLATTAPFFQVFLPLIFGVGICLMAVFGVMGVAKGKTLWLLRGQGSTGGFWVHGVGARVLGALYLVVMLPMFTVLGIPLSLGLLGIM